ncbi:MAG: phage tail tape measure protein [Candidatus Thiodiazotropha sp. (ex Dulcina madagascariensis)]|nr:phage tail tape measure protein [Candidatus Thiodiazotropha sp. (ex Dulcina madagascariensis)]
MSKSIAVGVLLGASLSKTFKSSFKTLEERAKSARKNLKGLTDQKKRAASLIRLGKSLENLKDKQKKLGRSTPELDRQIAKLTRRYNQAQRAASQYGINVKNAAARQSQLTRSISKTERQLKRVGQSRRLRRAWDEVGTRAAAYAGAAYVGARAVGTAQTFARAGTRLGTVVTGPKVGDALIQSKRQALQFARRTGENELDVLNSEYALNSAGIDADTSRAGALVVAKVARVTGGVAERTGEVIATTFNNLSDRLAGPAQERIERIGDLFAKTQFRYQIRDMGQLGESLKYASAPLAQYNVDLEQGLALLGSLNSTAIQGSRAGTAMDATFRQMSKAAEEFGFDIVRTEGGALDFIATLTNLSDSIGGLDNMDQSTIDTLNKVFGSEGVDMVQLLGKENRLQKLRLDESYLKTSKPRLDVEFQKFTSDAQGEWDRLNTSVRTLGTSISTALLPAITPVVGALADTAGWLGEVVDEMPNVTLGLGALTASFSAFRALSMGKAIVKGDLGKAADIATMKKGRSSLMRVGKVLVKNKGMIGAVAGRAGLVGAAGAAGYGAGTLINDHLISGTKFGDAIGEGVARVLAFLGSDEAKSTLALSEKNAAAINQTTHITVNPPPGADPRAIAEELDRLQGEQMRAALFDGVSP